MAQTIEEDVWAVVVQASKMTKDTFIEAIKSTLSQISEGAEKSGKQSLNHLIKDGSTLQNIEVTEKNIKSFEHSAKAYGIDYALKKLPDDENPTYVVFFKGKDAQQVHNAFNHYMRRIAKEHEKPSVVKKMKHLDAEQQDKDRQRVREQKKDRGMDR